MFVLHRSLCPHSTVKNFSGLPLPWEVLLALHISIISLLYIFNPEYLDIAKAGGEILFFIQQAVIMTSFIFTKKMLDLCKSYFSSN